MKPIPLCMLAAAGLVFASAAVAQAAAGTHAIRVLTPEAALKATQAALQECAVVGRDVQRKASRDLGAKSLENVKAAGMEVTELTPEAQNAMREAVKPVYEKHAATIGQEVVDRMMAELKKLRGE